MLLEPVTPAAMTDARLRAAEWTIGEGIQTGKVQRPDLGLKNLDTNRQLYTKV